MPARRGTGTGTAVHRAETPDKTRILHWRPGDSFGLMSACGPMNDPREIKRLLECSTTIAVVGLSANPGRPSHAVARYMQTQGYRIVPVNPNHQAVLGELCYPSLLDIPSSTPIDLVNVFRRPDAVPLVVEQTMQIGVGAIWMQEGVVDGQAARKAEEAGLTVVMDRCLLKEHSQYI